MIYGCSSSNNVACSFSMSHCAREYILSSCAGSTVLLSLHPMPTFKQVSVFTSQRFDGNPVAVFFDADDLSTEEMQTISNWTNLSETTFVLKPTDPQADYRVRIFTPGEELPFAGHPTIGTCHAVLESGLAKPSPDGKVYQQCGAGIVELTVEGETIKFALPYFKISDIDSETTAAIEDSLNLDAGVCSQVAVPKLVEDGPKWLTINVASAAIVNSIQPDLGKIRQLSAKHGWTGYSIFGKYPDGSYEARNFAPVSGVDEDPVCGSGAGADAAFLATYSGFRGHLNILQGRHKGRSGKISAEVKEIGGEIKISVGGSAGTHIEGKY